VGAVALVAGDGAAYRRQLGADLVPAPRLQGQLDEAEAVAPGPYPVTRNGAQRPARTRRDLPDPIRIGVRQPAIEYTVVVRRRALDECRVATLVDRLVPCRHQRGLGAGVLGEHDDARGVAVEAVHHGRPTLGVAPAYVGRDDVVEALGPGALGRYGR